MTSDYAARPAEWFVSKYGRCLHLFSDCRRFGVRGLRRDLGNVTVLHPWWDKIPDWPKCQECIRRKEIAEAAGHSFRRDAALDRWIIEHGGEPELHAGKRCGGCKGVGGRVTDDGIAVCGACNGSGSVRKVA